MVNLDKQPVRVGGHDFTTIRAAAAYYQLPYTTLYQRLRRYAPDDPRIIKPVSAKHRRQQDKRAQAVEFLGVTYPSMSALAQAIGIAPRTLKARIQRFGLTPRILRPAHYVVINGKAYLDVRHAARHHHMPLTTLRGRLRAFGYNDPRLFVKRLSRAKKGGERHER